MPVLVQAWQFAKSPAEMKSLVFAFSPLSRPNVARLEPAESHWTEEGKPTCPAGLHLEASAPRSLPGPPGLVEEARLPVQ